jgi:2-dehydropantoate 2-reductase
LLKHHDPTINVTLIVRGEHGRRLNEQGSVKLDGPWGSWQVPITTSFEIEDIAGSDFVLCTVKSQCSEQAVRNASRHLAGATLISIQNGINDPILSQFVPPERLVMGMTATNMAVLEPGSVSLQLDGSTVIGPAPDGANADAAHSAAQLLRKTGLQIDEHSNVLGARYYKLAINVLGNVSCLSQSNFITEAVCHSAWRSKVGLPLLAECINAFEAANIQLAKIPGWPDVNNLRRFLHLLDVPLIGSVLGLTAKRIYNTKPVVFSLSQDLRRGKPTEVDYINGEVVRLATEHGTDARLNELAVEMCHELERRGPASFFTRDEVVQRCQSAASRQSEQSVV